MPQLQGSWLGCRQAGVCHAAGAHRNQWRCLRGREGDRGDAGGLGWQASCLQLWGHPGDPPVSPEGAEACTPGGARQGSSCIHTWMDAISGNGAAMWPAALIVPHRAGPQAPFQNPPEPGGLWRGALSRAGRADGIRASVRRRGRTERRSFHSPVPVTPLPKTALLEFSLR